MTTPTDVVALISIIGELVKQETRGKWFLEKRYGTYNPIYEPNIVTGDGNVILISSQIVAKTKWRVSSLDTVFIAINSKLTQPIKWKMYAASRENLTMLE